MRVAPSLRVLVIAGWRVLLKLCFQVFIVLSSADEAGTCRVYEGTWGGAALRVSRVRVSGRRSRSRLSLTQGDDDDEFIPPGAKHLKGTALCTSQSIHAIRRG